MTTTALVPVFAGTLAGQPQQLCNARDLHGFLAVGRDFTTWIKSRVEEYGFAEGEDYAAVTAPPIRGAGNRGKRTDYHLTLDMAKELAMIENNDQGRAVRRYFIQCERSAQQSAAGQLTAQPVPQARAEKKRIRSREDLSFTKRDAEGRLINWHLDHDRYEKWGPLYEVGQAFLNQEIAELAAHDEREAYYAVMCALSGSHEFRRGPTTHFGNSGWGQECGFAEAIARAVVEGLRARRDGAAAYDPEAKKPPKLPKGAAPLALPAPMKELSKEEREAINKRAWAETSECARECFAKRRAEMLNAAH